VATVALAGHPGRHVPVVPLLAVTPTPTPDSWDEALQEELEAATPVSPAPARTPRGEISTALRTAWRS